MKIRIEMQSNQKQCLGKFINPDLDVEIAKFTIAPKELKKLVNGGIVTQMQDSSDDKAIYVGYCCDKPVENETKEGENVQPE